MLNTTPFNFSPDDAGDYEMIGDQVHTFIYGSLSIADRRQLLTDFAFSLERLAHASPVKIEDYCSSLLEYLFKDAPAFRSAFDNWKAERAIEVGSFDGAIDGSFLTAQSDLM